VAATGITPIQVPENHINVSWPHPLIITTFAVMNILRSWREQKVLLKRRFENLTDEDFVYEEGKREFMLERLSAKLGKTKSELELIFAEIQLS
jgi:hypothetical protein